MSTNNICFHEEKYCNMPYAQFRKRDYSENNFCYYTFNVSYGYSLEPSCQGNGYSLEPSCLGNASEYSQSMFW